MSQTRDSDRTKDPKVRKRDDGKNTKLSLNFGYLFEHQSIRSKHLNRKQFVKGIFISIVKRTQQKIRQKGGREQ